MEVENNKTGKPLEHYTAEFRELDPTKTAERCGVEYDSESGCFKLHFLGHDLLAAWPEFELRAADPSTCPASLLADYAQILVLRYLLSGRDSGASNEFISYREFPWGAVYDANFQGRCIKRLAFGFGFKVDAFKNASIKLGGKPLTKGDASYEFALLGSAKMRLILYAGDDEFPPSSQFLFSLNCESAFTAEDLAVSGDLIINALKELSK